MCQAADSLYPLPLIPFNISNLDTILNESQLPKNLLLAFITANDLLRRLQIDAWHHYLVLLDEQVLGQDSIEVLR